MKPARRLAWLVRLACSMAGAAALFAGAGLSVLQAAAQSSGPSSRPQEFPSPAHVKIFSILGMLFGAFWFVKGFWVFRKYRVLADTPRVPIRSAAMGLVEIHGTAVGSRTLLSPVSNVPCYMYRVEIERWLSDSRGSGRWSHRLTDSAWVRFRLQDETGEIEVDPQGAEFDLEPSGQREVGRHPGLLPGHAWENEAEPDSGPGLPVSDSQLRRYIFRATSGMHTAAFQSDDPAPSDSVKWEQQKPRFKLGRLFANPLASLQSGALGFPGGGYTHTADDYRLTEYCLFPGNAYDVTGTCRLDSRAKSPPRLVIGKGSNAPTFLITNRTETDIEGTLRARARLYILGGGLLVVGCAAVLLESLGLIF